MVHPVDRASWPRKELFDFFSQMSQPFFSVTFRQDVTRLCQFTRETRASFYYSLGYLCTAAINSIEAFRYGFQGEDLVLFDRRVPSFTDLHPGAEHFHIVTLPCEGSIQAFSAAAREQSRTQTTLFSGEEGPDLIYFTCLPWVELTALTNERQFDLNDAIPRVAWGRYIEEQGRKLLHISLELNHRFVDGLHVGRFHEALSDQINAL